MVGRIGIPFPKMGDSRRSAGWGEGGEGNSLGLVHSEILFYIQVETGNWSSEDRWKKTLGVISM